MLADRVRMGSNGKTNEPLFLYKEGTVYEPFDVLNTGWEITYNSTHITINYTVPDTGGGFGVGYQGSKILNLMTNNNYNEMYAVFSDNSYSRIAGGLVQMNSDGDVPWSAGLWFPNDTDYGEVIRTKEEIISIIKEPDLYVGVGMIGVSGMGDEYCVANIKEIGLR